MPTIVRSFSDQSIGSTDASPTNRPVCASVPRRRSERTADVEAARMPRALDRHVDAQTVRLLAEELRHLDRRGVENGRDAERLGPRAPGGVRLRDVDGGGAGGARAQRSERADRPRARHEHAVAGRHARTLDAVGSNRRRLDQRPLPVVDRLGEADDLVLGHHRELGHPAPGVREPDTCHRRAEVLQPPPAVAHRPQNASGMIATRSPSATLVTPGPVSTTSPANSWPRICGFCAPVSGCGSTGVTIGPADVLVQVGAADAAGRDAHDDVAGPGADGSGTSSTLRS